MNPGCCHEGELSRCPTCSTVLPSFRLPGYCPACAWRDLTDTDRESSEASTTAGTELFAVPGHRVLKEIARGGMGIVYRAQQLVPARTVALKMLLPHQTGVAQMRERFRIEAQAIATLDHPAILPVYQVGEYEGLPFFTMKYMAGGTLGTRCEAYRGQFRAIAELVITLAKAVHFAHEHGVLHRDLKPGNILFDDAGRPYVSDFGLAKILGADEGLTHSAHFMGTPHYVAPEVAARCARFATTASDIYSLGAILYELLTGRRPFEAEGMPALLKKIAEDEPARFASPEIPSAHQEAGPRPRHRWKAVNSVPRDLEIICLKCLAKEPAQRYASAHELAEDLRRWLDGRPILAQPVPRTERLLKWVKRNPAIAALAVMLLLALAGSAVTLARSNRRLQQALGASHAALQESLIIQARFARKSGYVGQHSQALALVDRAVKLAPPAQVPDPARILDLRAEAAGALALPDLRPLARWPVYMSTWNSKVEFTDDLAYYAEPAREGGFRVCATADRRVVRQYPGPVKNPAVQFRFSHTGSPPRLKQTASQPHLPSPDAGVRWVAVVFQDGHAEVHALASDQPPRRFFGGSAARTEVEFLPGAHQVVVSGYQQGLLLHDLIDGSRRELIPPPATVRSPLPAPGGERLACFAQNAVQIRRITDGALLWSVPVSKGELQLAWSPDGRHLAIAESAQPFEITVLDLDSRPVLPSPATNAAELVALPATGPDGNFNLLNLAATSVSNTFAPRVVAHFQDHALSASRLAFHPDGNSLVSAGSDNCLVWRQLVQGGLRIVGQAGWRELQFSSDGRRLAYEPDYGQVGLLEIVPSKVFHEWRRTTPLDEEAYMLAVSPDGRLLATASVRGVHLWDTTARAQIAHLALSKDTSFTFVGFHPNGRALLYSALGIGVIQVDIKLPETSASGKAAPGLGVARRLGENVNCLLQQIAPDGKSLIVAEIGGLDSSAPRVWWWPDALPSQARLLAQGFPLDRYALTPDGRWGVTSHLTEPDVWVWDPRTGLRARSLGIRQASGSRISPNGRWLLVTTREQHQLWEIGSWRPGPSWAHSLQHGDWAAAFSADGDWVATTTLEGEVEIRALPGATVVLRLPPPQPLRIHYLAFSPDRQRLFLWQSSGRLLEWNLAELRPELAKRGLDWAD